MRQMSVVVSAIALLALTGCGDKGATGPKPSLDVRFVNGATPPAGASLRTDPTTAAAAVPKDGEWLLSPDRVVLTVKHIQLGTSSNVNGPGADVSCAATFDRSKPGLAQLADCPFAVDPGTYTSVAITLDPSFQIVLNDAANGFYTTASGITTTAPSGGAQPLTLTAGNGSLAPFTLPANLVVADSGATATVSVVVNGLQFLRVDVKGGAVSVGWAGTPVTTATLPPLVATAGSIAGVEFYSLQSVGTAGSYCAAGPCKAPTGFTSVAAYYTGPSTVAIVGTASNDLSVTCLPIGAPGFVNDRRGYPGLDGAGNLGWAVATDANWTTYAAEFRMARASGIGGTTTLYCQKRSTDPAPSGGSYASGAPNIASPANVQGTFVLLAR